MIEDDGITWVEVGDNQDVLVTSRHETDLLKHFDTPEHRCFVDVGAHRGKYALRMAKHYYRVIALEPDPKQFAVLVENIITNNMDRVIAFPVAAWDTKTSLRLEERPGTSRVRKGGSDVRAETLDQVAGNFAIDLVKIDVEGAEPHVLRGMQDILKNWGPKLVIEMHDRLWPDEDITNQVEQVLRLHDYTWDDVEMNSHCHHYIASKL